MELLQQALRHYAKGTPDIDGVVQLAIPGLELFCATRQGYPRPALYKPVLCLVLQGEKELADPTGHYRFGAGQSLIVCADRPVTSSIRKASASAPYMALALELDMGVVRDLLGALEALASDGRASPPGLLLRATDSTIEDLALRLLRLQDDPPATAILAPGLIREIHYWLLTGPQGKILGALARAGGPSERIGRALALLRNGFAQPLRLEDLAAAAGMSASSFHQHFKAITSLSPRQFQKRLRLQEARRLLLGQGYRISQAAIAVGYQSVPHFTRDYGRLFAVPPGQDVETARDAA